MKEYRFVPLNKYIRYSEDEMLDKAVKFNLDLQRRRTVRDYSDQQIPISIINECIKAAGTAPSGANLQPWHFVVVQNPEVKKQIRTDAEVEEKEFYTSRAPEEWLKVLEPLGTDENKPFLETAPYLIAIFEKKYELLDDNTKVKNYYAKESVGIASGILITALHNVGLATLTHTPSPMNFLNKILERPINEKPFLLLVVGYPSDTAKIPDIKRKSLDEISTVI